MSEDSKKPTQQPDYSPEIKKGWDEKPNHEKLHYPDSGRSIKEGYQPIVDITSPPPGGGSGVPDKDSDS